MGVNTTAGLQLWLGTTASVAATDTYVRVAELLTVGKFGRRYNTVNYSPLDDRGVQKFKGSFDEGNPEISLGKDINDAGQTAMLAALLVDADYNIKLVANDDLPPASATVTMATGTPGVVTDTAHGLPAGSPVKFTTTGGLLTGIVAGTTYYVKTVIDANSYSLAATVGGTAIDLSSTQSGVHTRTTVPVGSYQMFKAKIMAFETGYDGGVDSVIGATSQLAIKSGSLTEQVHLP